MRPPKTETGNAPSTKALHGELTTAAERKAIAQMRILFLRAKANLQNSAVNLDIALERGGARLPWYFAAIRRKEQMESLECQAELLLAEREYLMIYGDLDIPENPLAGIFTDAVAKTSLPTAPGKIGCDIPMIEMR